MIPVLMDEYFLIAASTLRKVQETQRHAILSCVDAIVTSLKSGGIIATFGTGHSSLVCLEAYGKAGGLAPVLPMIDYDLSLLAGESKSEEMERLPGLGKCIFRQYTLDSRDALIVVSNSGRNAVPIEVAMEAKTVGMHITAITSLKHANSFAARHPDGRNLHEYADVVIDTCVEAGDAVLNVPGTNISVGPLSTLVGIAIVDAIACEVAERLAQTGINPPVFKSANADGSASINAELKARYANRIKF